MAGRDRVPRVCRAGDGISRGVGYTPYANAAFYDNMCGTGCRNKIAEHWTPHLDGKRSIPDALSALVTAFR